MEKYRIYKAYTFLVIVVLLFVCTFGLGISNVYANDDESIDTSVKVTRVINAAPKVVNNKFTYIIVPESSNPAPVTGINNTFEIPFSNISAPEAYASLYKQIDFNSAVYTKPGDYTFKIKETASTDSTSYPLSTDEWTIIMSIRYKMVNGVPTRDLITKSFVVADASENKKDNAVATFVGDAKFASIVISNQTEGNMANLNKYFKIRVDIEGTAGDQYKITGQDSTIDYEGKDVTTSNIYTVGSEPQYIYLKDDQEVTIGKDVITSSGELSAQETIIQREIKVGTKYQVEEIGSEAYKTYINGSTKPNKLSQKYTLPAPQGVIRILNVYETEILTGALIKYLPYVLILLIAVLALTVLLIKRKKQ